MGFVDGNLKTTLTTSQFGFGTASEPHIIGFNLTTETVLGHNYVSMKDTIDSINVALPGTTYQVLVQGIKQSIVGPYNVDVMASIDYVKFVSLDGVTAEMGTSNPTTDYVHAFLLYSDYDAVYETYSTVAIHVDSAMVTIPASANDEPEVFFTPGFNLIGKFDGTDDHGHDFVHATLRMIVFEYADSTKAA